MEGLKLKIFHPIIDDLKDFEGYIAEIEKEYKEVDLAKLIMPSQIWTRLSNESRFEFRFWFQFDSNNISIKFFAQNSAVCRVFENINYMHGQLHVNQMCSLMFDILIVFIIYIVIFFFATHWQKFSLIWMKEIKSHSASWILKQRKKFIFDKYFATLLTFLLRLQSWQYL